MSAAASAVDTGGGAALRPSVAAGSARWALRGAASPLVLAAVIGASFALVLFSLVMVGVPRELFWLAVLQVTLGGAQPIKTCRALVMRGAPFPRLSA